MKNARYKLFSPARFLPVLALICIACQQDEEYYSASDFERVPKADAHFHYLSSDPAMIEYARSIGFRLVTPIWEGEEVAIGDQFDFSAAIQREYPRDYLFFAAFPTGTIHEPGFGGRTIEHIKRSLAAGAAGVKIWKNIGMVLRYPSGEYVMIDDPVFEPVFRFLESEGIPVIAHLGEPRNCWLPLHEMTDRGDSAYYSNHPQYHMYLHPGVPSYTEQIGAMEKLLAKYPGLDFTGAHLASLEWSTDELAERLDAYPNLHVDMAARIGHLHNQSRADREKVREFMIRYQDRIQYGTDLGFHDDPDRTAEEFCAGAWRTWQRDWIFMATDSTVNGITGLRLPARVIDKIWFRNASRYFNHP